MPESQTHTFAAEIFSAGTWNGDAYTVADLEEIAANFTRLRGEVKPPLKFGHDPAQTLSGQSDGDPALGWVEGLRVVGDKLIATFAEVPTLVMEAIRAGRYRRVSAEIWSNVRRGGAALGKALKAVALLGADLPAVTNLQDLTAYLTDASVPDATWQPEHVLTFTGPLRTASPILMEGQMTESAHAGQGAEQVSELDELRAFKARQEAQALQDERRRADDAFRRQRDGALAFCEARVRAGTLAPALRDRVTRELDAQARQFSVNAGLLVPWSLAQALLEGEAVLPGRDGTASELAFASVDPADDAGAGNASARLAALAQRKMVELNTSYSHAAQYVLKTNPGLARAYRDYTLNPQTGG